MSNVFGLDIGTRNVVGTVGYKTPDDEFIVVAQYMRQHETRSMLDGQIHDIGRVAKTIGIVKEELERQVGEKLTDVCIAAAGRVLKTVTTHIEYEFPEETVVSDEDLHTLNLLGIEKAQDILKEKNDTSYKFYCVGYSVVKFYLNDELFISIEGHKANKIGEDIIVTFLPEDVVDGLYTAVGQAGLQVANMTLEPIAAINVAIPENYRMLNIALVDVGAGTISSSQTEDVDWINTWKKFFQSFYIDDILIKPTWEALKEEDKDKFLIEIDPGVSFGTGKHETTQLCIRQLRKYLKKGDRVLDVGCGSGILSIVAMKLGASHVVGTDLDENCMTSTYENMEVNHLPKEMGEFYVGNLIDDVALQEKVGTEVYDIVVANILADVIIPMAPVIPARLKKGGVFITSGIIDFKENEVKEAIEKAGLTVLEINHQGEWVNITAQKN